MSKKTCEDTLHNYLLNQSYWWSYCPAKGAVSLQVSPALVSQYAQPPQSLQELVGSENVAFLVEKFTDLTPPSSFENSFENKNQPLPEVFSLHYATLSKEHTWHYQLSVLPQSDPPIFVAQLVNIPDTSKHAMAEKTQLHTLVASAKRQQDLEEQNQVIQKNYQNQARFLAMLSHELRSPLLGIASLSKNIREQDTLSSNSKQKLKTIHITAEQLTYLVNDILTYSQSEYGDINIHPQETCLLDLLRHIENLITPLVEDKKLRFSMQYKCSQNLYLVDKLRLTQVLINLVVNSVKFTQQGEVALLVTEAKAGECEFTVTDTGIGMTAAQCAQVFEPFSQVQESARHMDNYLGTGLGLYIVRELVRLMGGEITVTSTPGEGATFSFVLKFEPVMASNSTHFNTQINSSQVPLNAKEMQSDGAQQLHPRGSHKTALVTTQPVLQPATHTPKHILIADDSSINRMVLCGYLHDLQHQVSEAKDGQEAWELFLQQPFDYVFLDIQMPIMDGLAVAKKIDKWRKKGKATHLKGVFAITAGGDSSQFLSSECSPQQLGFDEWLIKPVLKEQIIALLASDANARQAHNDNNASTIHTKKAKNAEASAEQNTGKESNAPTKLTASLPSREQIPEQFHTLIDEFIKEAVTVLDRIENAWSNSNFSSVKEKAHYLKGNCMLFHLHGMAANLKFIEALAEDNMKKVKTLNEDDTAQNAHELYKLTKKLHLAVKSLEKSAVISHNTDIKK